MFTEAATYGSELAALFALFALHFVVLAYYGTSQEPTWVERLVHRAQARKKARRRASRHSLVQLALADQR